MRPEILSFLELVPETGLNRIVLETKLKAEERFEDPRKDYRIIGFESLSELKNFLALEITSDLRTLSIHFKYTECRFIFLDVLVGKVKISNSFDLLSPTVLAEKGLLGPSGPIQYFEIAF